MKTRRRFKQAKILIKLLGVFGLCYLQSYWPSIGMPMFLQVGLWVVYAAQILILSCRLFGIKIIVLSNVIGILPELMGSKWKKD